MSGQNRFIADLFKDLLSVSSVKFLVTRALGFEGFFFCFILSSTIQHTFSHHPLYLIESLISVLIFESVDEMLRFDHSNETSSAALSVGVICI